MTLTAVLVLALNLQQPAVSVIPRPSTDSVLRLVKRASDFAEGGARSRIVVGRMLDAPLPGPRAFFAELTWEEKGKARVGVAKVFNESVMQVSDPEMVPRAFARHEGWLLMGVFEDTAWDDLIRQLAKAVRTLAESSAIGDIRSMLSAQAAYQAMAEGAGYAPTLACSRATLGVHRRIRRPGGATGGWRRGAGVDGVGGRSPRLSPGPAPRPQDDGQARGAHGGHVGLHGRPDAAPAGSPSVLRGSHRRRLRRCLRKDAAHRGGNLPRELCSDPLGRAAPQSRLTPTNTGSGCSAIAEPRADAVADLAGERDHVRRPGPAAIDDGEGVPLAEADRSRGCSRG